MNHEDNLPGAFSRRNFILSGLAVAVSASSAQAFAKEGHAGHHHHHVEKNNDLLEAALDCTKHGKLCKDHCIELVKNGDTSIADCLDAVTDTIAMCETLAQLTASSSRHLKSFAKVCIEVCRDCEKECEAHKDMHKECRACMESCQQCIKQLEKVIA